MQDWVASCDVSAILQHAECHFLCIITKTGRLKVGLALLDRAQWFFFVALSKTMEGNQVIVYQQVINKQNISTN